MSEIAFMGVLLVVAGILLALAGYVIRGQRIQLRWWALKRLRWLGEVHSLREEIRRLIGERIALEEFWRSHTDEAQDPDAQEIPEDFIMGGAQNDPY